MDFGQSARVRGHSDSCSVCGRAIDPQSSSLQDNERQADEGLTLGEMMQPKISVEICKSRDGQHWKAITGPPPPFLEFNPLITGGVHGDCGET